MPGVALCVDNTVAHCIAVAQAWPMPLVQHFVTMLQPEHDRLQSAAVWTMLLHGCFSMTCSSSLAQVHAAAICYILLHGRAISTVAKQQLHHVVGERAARAAANERSTAG